MPAPSATVSFSGDEWTATVTVGATTWVMPRPYVTSWYYSPSGTTYYVDTAGNDGNAGTFGSPFLTIAHALSVAVAGDLIYVNAGDYVEAIGFSTSGTSGHPIILSCAPGALAQVRLTLSSAYVTAHPESPVIGVQANYIWINGLNIEGPRGRAEAPATEFYSACGVLFSGGAGTGCIVSNCFVHHNVHCGIKELGHGGTGILSEANVIFENGNDSLGHGIYYPCHDSTMHGNISFHNYGYGIHCYSSPANLSVTRNVVFANGGGILNSAVDSLFEYNTVCEHGAAMCYFRAGCTGNTVRHNIFTSEIAQSMSIDSFGGSPSDNHDDFNDYYPEGAYAGLDDPPGAGDIDVDPLFTNSAIGDLRTAEAAVRAMGAYGTTATDPFVQSAKSGTGTDGGDTTVACTFAAANAAGNTIAVAVQVGSSQSVSTITDNATGGSNIYVLGKVQGGGGNQTEIWHVENLKSTEALTVTANLSGAAGYRRIIACEYTRIKTTSAADGVDGKSTNSPGTGTDGVTSDSGSAPTTTAAGDLLFCATMTIGGAGTETQTAGTGFTKRDATTDAYKLAVEDRVLSGTGPVVGTWTYSADNAANCAVLALKAVTWRAPVKRFGGIPFAAIRHQRSSGVRGW